MGYSQQGHWRPARGPQLPKTSPDPPGAAREGPRTDPQKPQNAQTAFSCEVHRADPAILVPRLRLEV
eukprot:5211176-Pyramimonas_sp.AAC.1